MSPLPEKTPHMALLSTQANIPLQPSCMLPKVEKGSLPLCPAPDQELCPSGRERTDVGAN